VWCSFRVRFSGLAAFNYSYSSKLLQWSVDRSLATLPSTVRKTVTEMELVHLCLHMAIGRTQIHVMDVYVLSGSFLAIDCGVIRVAPRGVGLQVRCGGRFGSYIPFVYVSSGPTRSLDLGRSIAPLGALFGRPCVVLDGFVPSGSIRSRELVTRPVCPSGPLIRAPSGRPGPMGSCSDALSDLYGPMRVLHAPSDRSGPMGTALSAVYGPTRVYTALSGLSGPMGVTTALSAVYGPMRVIHASSGRPGPMAAALSCLYGPTRVTHALSAVIGPMGAALSCLYGPTRVTHALLDLIGPMGHIALLVREFRTCCFGPCFTAWPEMGVFGPMTGIATSDHCVGVFGPMTRNYSHSFELAPCIHIQWPDTTILVPCISIFGPMTRNYSHSFGPARWIHVHWPMLHYEAAGVLVTIYYEWYPGISEPFRFTTRMGRNPGVSLEHNNEKYYSVTITSQTLCPSVDGCRGVFCYIGAVTRILLIHVLVMKMTLLSLSSLRNVTCHSILDVLINSNWWVMLTTCALYILIIFVGCHCDRCQHIRLVSVCMCMCGPLANSGILISDCVSGWTEVPVPQTPECGNKRLPVFYIYRGS